MTTRVTSEQVDDLLMDMMTSDHSGVWLYRDMAIDICRDWLDMQARLGAMEAVVAAAQVVVREYLDDDGPDIAFGVAFQRLIEALDATQPTEDRR